MTWFWAPHALAFTVTLGQAFHPSCAEPLSPRSGSYEITTRLELPNVERWAIDQTTKVCLAGVRASGEIPVPVLSANNPFAKCAATNLAMEGATLQYDIVCPGRGAAQAHASYTLAADAFNGRVAMIMGAKNMTMTEVLRARRIGDCDTAIMPELAARF